MRTQKVINQSSLFLFITLLIIFALGWYLQTQQLFSWDVSWLAEASRRLMLGGNYTNDFFENNPPLILYLYMPPVSIAYWLDINIIWVMRLYVFSIATVSIGLTYFFSQKIFDKKTVFAQYMAILLACIYLILPFYEFGQREHLFLMLMMPYLFMMIVRVNNGVISRNVAMMIGVTAGLGFSIKPIFFLTFLLIEGYYYLHHKSVRGFIRAETLSISLVVLLYALVIGVLHQDYLINVLPYASRWTYVNINMPWEMLLFNSYLAFSLTVALLGCCFIHGQHKMVYRVLTLALIAAMVIYLIQQALWYYRILPMLSLATLLLGCIGYQVCSNSLIARTAANQPSVKSLIAVFTLFILSLPMFYFSTEMYRRSINYKQNVLAMAHYFDQHFYNKNVYFISTDLIFLPTFNYCKHSTNASRFSHMLGLGGLITGGENATEDKNYLIHMIVEDLEQKKPDIVLVDIRKNKRSIGYFERVNHQVSMHYLLFDYVGYFNSQPGFQRVWKSYHYKSNTPDKNFAVYVRS